MSQFKRNILANFFGKCWPALMALIFIPLYIRFMGVEAYGLVGIFASLQLILGVLDMGLSTTVNREVARLSAQVGKERDVRDLVRTLELIYWVVAGMIVGVIILLSPFISSHWVKPEHLSTHTVHDAVLMMGLAIAFQFPAALYSGGLLGLQRQVLFNGLTIVMTTMRGVGAVLILWLVSPTIQVFFSWQVIMSLALTLVYAICLWKNLAKAHTSPRFQKTLLLGIWRFAAGMSGISILATLLTQLDKIILSNVLTLEKFGYYSLATVVSSGLYLLASPIYTAVFPRFSQLVAQGDEDGLAPLYHQSCQLVSVVLLPGSLIVALFAKELLRLWTGNVVMVEQTHLLVSLLITGTALNVLMVTPCMLQLAYGWTRLVLYQNLVGLILLAPLMVWVAGCYGASGAAIVWIILNGGYLCIGPPIMHRRLLKGQLRQWYLVDIGLPFAGALVTALACRWWSPAHPSPPLAITWLAASSLLILLVSIVVTPYPRAWLKQYLALKGESLMGGIAHE